MSNIIWTIAKTVEDKAYYIVGINVKTQQIQWNSKRINCLKFESEATAANYLEIQLKKRKDVYILCINSLYPFF